MPSGAPTNVVLVVLDTLRRDAVGCYGQDHGWDGLTAAQTPNLDRIASQSIRFQRAYPEVLPTLPARRSLYTGRRVFPFRGGDFKLRGDFVSAPGWGPIPEDQDTMAELLGGAGYRTALISDVYHQFKPSKNYTRGFDQWTFVRGHEADKARSGPEPDPEFVERFIPRQLLELRKQSDERIGIRRRQVPAWAADLARNFYGRESADDWPVAKVFGAAIEWLEQNADARRNGQGAFLTVESFSPHEPWFCPPAYREMYDGAAVQDNVVSPYAEVSLEPGVLRRTRANYLGLVTLVDHWVGRFFEALERGGWLDDTLLIFLSDHGHSLLERGYMGKRGYPGLPEVFDLPALMRLPGGASAGLLDDRWVQFHDFAATILAATVGTDAAPLDGYDVRPLAPAGPARDHVVIGWGHGIIVINDEWWLSIKADGTGALLYPQATVRDSEAVSVAEAHPDVVEHLFNLALREAGGSFPDYILEAAALDADATGCSPVAAVALTPENLARRPARPPAVEASRR